MLVISKKTPVRRYDNFTCNHFSKLKLLLHPTHPLRLITTNNASHSCITAAAGTCIGHDFSSDLITLCWSANELYSYHSLPHSHQFDGSCDCKLPNIPHCCLFGRVVLIPYVADSSSKSTRDRWLMQKKYCY